MYLTQFLLKGHKSQLASRLFAALSVSLALALLIVVSSVFNGFQIAVTDKFYQSHPHLHVYLLDDQAALLGQLHTDKNIQTARIKNFVPVMVSHGQRSVFAMLTEQPDMKESASISHILTPLLALNSGSKVRVSVLSTESLMPMPTHMTFNTGIDYSTNLASITVKNMGRLVTGAGHRSVLELWLKDENMKMSYQQTLLKQGYQVLDMGRQLNHLLSSLSIQKMTMMFIFALITLLLSFQLLSLLRYMVQSLELPIAYLTVSGVPYYSLWRFLFSVLTAIVVVAIIAGVFLGWVISFYATQLCAGLEKLLQQKIMTTNAFMLDYLPSDINIAECFLIAGVFFLISCVVNALLVSRALSLDPVGIFRRGQYA